MLTAECAEVENLRYFTTTVSSVFQCEASDFKVYSVEISGDWYPDIDHAANTPSAGVSA